MIAQHRPRTLRRALAVAVVSGALVAPGAAARPAPPDRSPASESSAAGPTAQLVPTPSRATDGGLEWASAAIGAGAAGALLLLTSAGGLTYRTRRNRGMRPAA